MTKTHKKPLRTRIAAKRKPSARAPVRKRLPAGAGSPLWEKGMRQLTEGMDFGLNGPDRVNKSHVWDLGFIVGRNILNHFKIARGETVALGDATLGKLNELAERIAKIEDSRGATIEKTAWTETQGRFEEFAERLKALETKQEVQRFLDETRALVSHDFGGAKVEGFPLDKVNLTDPATILPRGHFISERAEIDSLRRDLEKALSALRPLTEGVWHQPLVYERAAQIYHEIVGKA